MSNLAAINTTNGLREQLITATSIGHAEYIMEKIKNKYPDRHDIAYACLHYSGTEHPEDLQKLLNLLPLTQ